MKLFFNNTVVILMIVLSSTTLIFAVKDKNKRQLHYHSSEHIMRRSAQSMYRAEQPLPEVPKQVFPKTRHLGKKDHQRHDDRSR